MKIYTIDAGWRGAVAIVADSKEEAFEMAKEKAAYCSPETPDEFEEHEIEKGLVLDCAGDR